MLPYTADRIAQTSHEMWTQVAGGPAGSRLEGARTLRHCSDFAGAWTTRDPGAWPSVSVEGRDAGNWTRDGSGEARVSQCAVSGRESHSPNSQSRVGERRGSGGRPGGRRQAQAMSGKGRGDTGPSPDAGDAGTVDRIHATARWMGSTHHGSSRSGFALPGPFGGRGSGDEHEGAGRGMRLADRRPGPREARFFTA